MYNYISSSQHSMLHLHQDAHHITSALMCILILKDAVKSVVKSTKEVLFKGKIDYLSHVHVMWVKPNFTD